MFFVCIEFYTLTAWIVLFFEPPREKTNNLCLTPGPTQTRSLEFQILEEEGLYCLCSENKGIDQLCSYCAFVFAYANCRFSEAVAHLALFLNSSKSISVISKMFMI